MPIKTTIAGLLCGIVIAGLPAVATNRPAANRREPAKPTAQAAPAPPAEPQLPPTPEEMPATPPQVSFSAAGLSIVAENSTLGDVLNAVRRLMGAGIEVPNTANSERIAVHLGPGKPQDVLQQLLEGSKFNYIILGSPDNPTAIQKVILTARTPGGVGPTGPVNNASNYYPEVTNRIHSAPPPPDYQGQNDAGVGTDDEVVQPESPSAEEVSPPEGQSPPAEQQQQQYSGPSGQAQQQQGPKTPEQLLQELQRMQQQQQSQDQQQTDQSEPNRSNAEPE
ncbi:MAG TPA: hypothetical protein VG897_17605 [Terriglobales bacterium]|nr:hypothetical protein [Terriglobales bacterium]